MTSAKWRQAMGDRRLKKISNLHLLRGMLRGYSPSLSS